MDEICSWIWGAELPLRYRKYLGFRRVLWLFGRDHYYTSGRVSSIGMIDPSRNYHQHHVNPSQGKIDALANPHTELSTGGKRPPVPTNHRRPKCPDDNSQGPLERNGSDFNIPLPCIIPFRQLHYHAHESLRI